MKLPRTAHHASTHRSARLPPAASSRRLAIAPSLTELRKSQSRRRTCLASASDAGVKHDPIAGRRSVTFSRTTRCALFLMATLELAAPPWCTAQPGLSLRDAVDQALQSRASLKAEAERVPMAEGRKRQAGLWPNPE